MDAVTYNSPNNLSVGYGIPVKVNLSVGIERPRSFEREYKKVLAIVDLEDPPDLIMDLSLMATDKELWEVIRSKLMGPIGILPHCTVFNEKTGLDRNALLERINKLFENGVNFIIIHCSPSYALFSLAQKNRFAPVTSRGGSIVLRDMSLNKRHKNTFSAV